MLQRVPDRRPADALSAMERSLNNFEDIDIAFHYVEQLQLEFQQQMQEFQQQMQELSRQLEQARLHTEHLMEEELEQQIEQDHRQIDQNNRGIVRMLREELLRVEQLHVGAERAPDGIVQPDVNADVGVAERPAELAEHDNVE